MYLSLIMEVESCEPPPSGTLRGEFDHTSSKHEPEQEEPCQPEHETITATTGGSEGGRGGGGEGGREGGKERGEDQGGRGGEREGGREGRREDQGGRGGGGGREGGRERERGRVNYDKVKKISLEHIQLIHVGFHE